MNRSLLIVLGIVAVIGGIFFFSGVSWYNGGITKAEGVKATYRDNENVYDNFWKKVQESAQVPSQYKEDFKDLLVASNTAQYGKDGSQAAMQWFKERNIALPPELYMKLMNLIESGRNDFERGQRTLLDKQRVYATTLKTFWGRMLADFCGLPEEVTGALAPPKDLDGDGKLTVLDYPIVLSAKTNAAFATGEDEALNVFNKPAPAR